uniref:F-box protein At3g26010-like beta-propeller domain-containing protein n=1 Tax=Setaria italica TaxID=4555 RepID=K3XRC7_SETIT
MFCATRCCWRRSSRACCPSTSSSRYNALARRPDFAARYWRRAGVIFQPFDQPKEVPPRFLTGGGHARDDQAALVHGADLAFLPGPSAREEAYLRLDGSDPDGGFAVLHSAGGLQLCSRGRTRAVHLYVCNPVTSQWVALPELPLPVCKRHCGHLTVAADGAFTVVVANHASHWTGPGGGQLDIRVFASDTGRWEARRFPATVISDDVDFDDFTFCQPPMLGPSGTSAGAASDSLRVITLPNHLVDGGRCIGERHGGGLRYMESNRRVLQVWDAQD